MSKKKPKTSSSEEEGIAGVGHNQPGGVACEKLKSLVARFEKLEEEKQAVAEDMKEVMAEVKGQGFDTKIFRGLLKLRKVSEDERTQYFTVLDAYARAMGFSILDMEPADMAEALPSDNEED